MIDKGINVKKIDLSGVSFPTNDASTCALIYTAVRNTYGFPLYLTNFKINDEKRDSVLVSPIISENQTIINLNDCHLIVTPAEISVGKGVYEASLESIVDKDGNPRFVEGDITMESVTGVTQTYGKWSLSGTHLMIVLAGTIASGTYIGGYTNIANVNVPTYVLNKVQYLILGRIDVRRQYFPIYSKSAEILAQKLFFLAKLDNRLNIGSSAIDPITVSEDGYFRVQFDLLIDAD